VLARAKNLLGSVPLYVGLQKAIGADRVRYLCLDALEIKPGDRVLDVGCGPAYYLDRLPDVTYVGFDTSERYIVHARERWGARGEFRCEIFAEHHLAEHAPVDKVLLLGLLHHLDDESCRNLLDLAARSLAPGGRVICLDTAFAPDQNPIARWMSKNDRGEYVRHAEDFVRLAEGSFGDVTGELVEGVTRIPTTLWLMKMAAPLVGADRP
jgi:SAM-dependent methyltransferase